ncbi:sensor histidine kinase [Undibacterium arcticum]
MTLDPKLEIVLYRMLQETLSNVAKHAQARRVDLILDVDEDRVALTVRDDGIGIAPERRDNTSTYGLRGLYERAEFLGGKVAIVANQQRGTTVTIALPLTPPGP